MVSYSFFKNTLLFSLAVLASCNSISQEPAAKDRNKEIEELVSNNDIRPGADDYQVYLPILKDKRIGIVTNQTGIISWNDQKPLKNQNYLEIKPKYTAHIVDFLLECKIDITKIYAPEHGFRGTADAGELIKDGKDTKTGLPIISLYGDNKKPKPEQLEGIDILVFDLQDVGARFYTYISTLHYVMEACAENNIKLIVFDRPNPNGAIVDGPVLEKENTSFIGMHPVPVLHGMTMGEYAKMINKEKWLKNGIQCPIAIVPCKYYTHSMAYSLPVKPSPNLPNDKAINLYASLCFFEGTNVSVGRGTDKQFQVYGSPYLPGNKFSFTFTPRPNEGAKDPMHNGKTCYGEDLSGAEKVNRLELKWLIKAYKASNDKAAFFIPFFTKLAGTTKLQQQIENGMTEEEIRKSWEPGLESFRTMRKKYLIYPE